MRLGFSMVDDLCDVNAAVSDNTCSHERLLHRKRANASVHRWIERGLRRSNAVQAEAVNP